jgi:mono/diheme cytochrome c family protein
LFVDGRYAAQSTTISDITFTEDSTQVRIWPPLNVAVKDGETPVELAGNQIMLDFGSTMRSGRHLYMRHCMHCHGVTGDGNGPTAKYLSPLPRDYRQGVFKFISTPAATVKHPSREDLTRILRNGIPGTYMPSFSQLKDEEVQHIIEYVRWLSMRGLYEGRMNVLLAEYTNKAVADEIQRRVDTYQQDLEAGNVSKDKPAVTQSSVKADIDKNLAAFLTDELPEAIDEEANLFTESWRAAELKSNVIYPTVPKPPSSQESIARGRHLFLSKCAVCHGVTGEGNGENTRGYQKDPVTNVEYPQPGLFDVWGHPIKPRDLNTGIYRGGRRPLDIYRRIHQGIPGAGMQSFAAAFKDEQIWDIVDYVMSIPIQGPIPPQSATVAQALKPGAPKVAQSKDSAPGNAE